MRICSGHSHVTIILQSCGGIKGLTGLKSLCIRGDSQAKFHCIHASEIRLSYFVHYDLIKVPATSHTVISLPV